MSKMIAVCGAPSVGKTTAALKLAQEIYHSGKTSVLLCLPICFVLGASVSEQ